MNIPRIDIPSDVPDEFRALLEELNGMLEQATRDVDALHRDPESFSDEAKAEMVERANSTMKRFLEMREQLREYKLEWSEWPDVIGE